MDGAHNEDAAAKLADSIEFYFTNKRIIYIMGMLKDKEVDRVIALTEKYADQILTVTPRTIPGPCILMIWQQRWQRYTPM